MISWQASVSHSSSAIEASTQIVFLLVEERIRAGDGGLFGGKVFWCCGEEPVGFLDERDVAERVVGKSRGLPILQHAVQRERNLLRSIQQLLDAAEDYARNYR